MRNKIRFFDAFSGYGGFHLGITQAIPGAKCVGFSEIDSHAIDVYKKHFPNIKNYGDITKIKAKDLPDFDIFVGGFPCQAFSIAGKRGGLNDPRGTLFFEVRRILESKRPKNFILENVKGLLSHDDGRTFRSFIASLAELGYSVEWQVLNAKNFGVPQRRERVFIVGHFGAVGGRQVFPITGSNPNHLKEITSQVSDAQRVYDPSGLGKTLKALGGGLGAKTGLYMIQLPRGKNNGGKKDIAPAITGKSYQHNNFVAMTEIRTEEAKKMRREARQEGRDWSPRRGKTLVPRNDRLANTLTVSQGREQLMTDGFVIRKPTPVECERLMGLPDNWTENRSDSQRYKLCGNGVVVPVVKEITKRLWQQSLKNS